MTPGYGVVKCTLTSTAYLKGSKNKKTGETQYHLHADLAVDDDTWDVAVNVGTDDSDDLLRYRFAFDYHHKLTELLAALPPGKTDLTGKSDLPALDFLRSDVLAETGKWRDSDVMDGSKDREPYVTLARLLDNAYSNGWTVYFIGRFYVPEGNGVHDIHMNQGSTGSYVNHGPNDGNKERNQVWQDGAVVVQKPGQWVGYFTAFTQQLVPTDDLGNPASDAHEISDKDIG
jgi:uncharacterized protein YukJ